MLKSLSIKNLSLIEDAEVKFGPHFNVITGETGAGKSSFLRALSFALGERADSSYVRKGADKAAILAHFEKEGIDLLLQELGIDHEGPHVIIKREIGANGQSRAFINSQPVLVSTLEKVANSLINLASQQAHFELLQKDAPQKLLDNFGHIDLQEYQAAWQELNSTKKEYELLKKKLQQKEHLLKELYESQKLLKQADLLEEETALFAAYSTLISRQEIEELLVKVHTAFFSPDKNFLTLIERYLPLSEKIVSIHESLKNLRAEVSELSYTLDKLLSERGPSSSELEKKLKTIDRLKLHFGATYEECTHALEKVEKEIYDLEQGDHILENLEEKRAELEKIVGIKAREISEKRIQTAQSMEQVITEQLHSLHMPEALFHVVLTKTAPSLTGAESCEFMLTANLGERKTPLKGFVSGGELSRIMLAIKTVLAGPRPVLLFDEADAGIGGMTAVAVAQKLKSIAEKYQVICITHLPQMAEAAAHHFVIEKFAEEGRTYTKVTALKEKERIGEIKRMHGKRKMV